MKYNPKLADKINARPEENPKGAKPPVTAPQAEPETKQREYSFLGQDWGKQVHERIQKKYERIEPITKVIYDDTLKIVRGSTPFYVVAVNEFLRENGDYGIRTVTQADLEKILKTNALELKGNWEDSSLVWHSNRDPNAYLSTNLSEQARQKGITLTEGIPFVFPLCALSLKQDRSSPYKLSFILEHPELCFPAPILASISQQKFENADIDKQTGLPKEVRKDGTRTLFTRNHDSYGLDKMQGLSGLFLCGDLYVSSDSGVLAGSNEDGRVVVVRASATSQKI
jgi:hypothetical protein